MPHQTPARKTPKPKQSSLFTANPQQAAAIAHTDGPAAFIAAAGTGKTAILVQRLVRLIAEEGIAPETILCVTFTRAAADEMKKRALHALKAYGKAAKDVKGLHVTTFHGLGHLMLREKLGWAPQQLNQQIVSGDPRQWLAEDILRNRRSSGARGLNWDIPVADVLLAVDRAKEAVIAPEASADFFREEFILTDDLPQRFQDFFSEYEATKKKQKLYDLSDLIYIPLRLLEGSPAYRKQWQGRFHYLQVDETQDTNPSQYTLIQHLAAPKQNVVVVGDPDQCQPAGTLVRLSDGTDCPIERLEVGTRLTTYARHEATFIKNGIVTEIAQREYNGLLYTVRAAEKETDCTFNHRWLVRWTGENREARVTYLMRQGNRYRIGHTRLFLQMSYSSGNYPFGLSSRANQERADAAWILRVHENRADALIYEEILSAKYGLPEICFQQADGVKYFTQDMIDQVFQALDPVEQEQRALLCLSDHGRSVEYPMWLKRSQGYEDRVKTNQGRSTIFETQACNLISDYMAIPIAPDIVKWNDRYPNWQPITVTNGVYSGMVYSLNVATHHKYIANGLVTCNSIYQFRGATPEKSILSFKEMYPQGKIYRIEQNYRSTPQILDAANALISHNPITPGFEKILRPTRPDGLPVTVTAYEDQEREAEGIAQRINSLVREARERHEDLSWRDIFVLSRTNHHLASLEIVLARNQIPYRALGGSSFFKRKTTRDMLAFLALVDGMRLHQEFLAAQQGPNPPRREDVFTAIVAGEQNAAFRAVAHIPSQAFAARTGKASHRFTPALYAAISASSSGQPLLQFVAEHGYVVPAEHQLAMKDFVGLIRSVAEASHNRPEAAIKQLRLLAYDAHLRHRDARGNDEADDEDDAPRSKDETRVEGRFDELDELQQIASKHHTIRHFLQAMAQLKEQAEDTSKNKRDCVALLTVHKSKGLEQKVVFVMGMVEGIFPHKRSYTANENEDVTAPSGIPEERRLAYVAFTRAQQQLYLSTLLRYRGADATPSRFVHEANLSPTTEEGNLNPFLMRAAEPSKKRKSHAPAPPSLFDALEDAEHD